MSLLVEIRKQPRIINGKLVHVGESCRLPNALAVALEDTGLVAWPTEKVAITASKAKSEKRKASKAKAEDKARKRATK